MLPDNLAISMIDVLQYHQKKESIFVAARAFSALTLRMKTPGKYVCKNKAVPFKPYCICIVPEGVAYERSTMEEDILVIHFNMLNYVLDEIQVFEVNDGEKYERLFLKALELKQRKEPRQFYRITSVVYEIFSELIYDVGFTSNEKDNWILEAAEYMRQNLGDPQLHIEDLAQRAFVSTAFFRREFHRVYGTSPKDYLDTLRIQYARSLLETGYFSQSEISAQCGFTNVGYFRTVFKKKVGKTMREYLADATRHNY